MSELGLNTSVLEDNRSWLSGIIYIKTKTGLDAHKRDIDLL